LRLALQGAIQGAASDTGAIEGLYKPDRGFTVTVMTQAAMWAAELAKKAPDVQALLKAQLQAYELALDISTKSMPVSEAWIRRVHEVICGPQESYDVYVDVAGVLQRQKRPLPKGEYKSLPNHVRLRDGSVHSYAPVAETGAEMHRLITEIGSTSFESAHPVLQSAYVHYGLTAIHPFADGNGRVARVIASAYLLRATSVPFLLLYDQKDAYLDALAAADGGRLQSFTRFVGDRSRHAMRLVAYQLGPSPERAFDELGKLLVAPSGLSHDEISEVAQRLLEMVANEVEAQLAATKLPRGVNYRVQLSGTGVNYSLRGYAEARKNGPRNVYIGLQSDSPLAGTSGTFGVFVGRPDEEEPILLTFDDGGRKPDRFAVALADVVPTETAAFRGALSAWVRSILGLLAEGLRHQISDMLNRAVI
jgi:fido (protein-threonine AMPylation protein)